MSSQNENKALVFGAAGLGVGVAAIAADAFFNSSKAIDAVQSWFTKSEEADVATEVVADANSGVV